jgi:hypothetical protein
MAKVYDVALEVRFVPFSKLVNRISGTPYIERGLSSDAMDVPSFEEEKEEEREAESVPVVEHIPAVAQRIMRFQVPDLFAANPCGPVTLAGIVNLGVVPAREVTWKIYDMGGGAVWRQSATQLPTAPSAGDLMVRTQSAAGAMLWNQINLHSFIAPNTEQPLMEGLANA